jgi:hypothetical protein
MYEFTTKSTIRSSPERVWEILTDGACYSEWNPEIVAVDGRIALGERIRARVKVGSGAIRTVPLHGRSGILGLGSDDRPMQLLVCRGWRSKAPLSHGSYRRRHVAGRRRPRSRRAPSEPRGESPSNPNHGQLRPGRWPDRFGVRASLLPLHRSSREALQLLRHGLVHVAGIHLSAAENRSGNARAAREILGNGFSLLRFATWDEGLAVHPSTSCSSVNAVVRANLRWVGREPGAGAPQCQDEILGNRHLRHCAVVLVDTALGGAADSGLGSGLSIPLRCWQSRMIKPHAEVSSLGQGFPSGRVGVDRFGKPSASRKTTGFPQCCASGTIHLARAGFGDASG